MQNEVIAENRALDTMTDGFEDEIDSVTAAVSTKVRILEPTPGDRLDFKLAVLSGSEEDEVSEVK